MATTQLGMTIEALKILADCGEIDFVTEQKGKLEKIYKRSETSKKYENIMQNMTPQEQHEFLMTF